MKNPLPLLVALAALAVTQPAATAQTAELVARFNAAAREFPESIAIDRAGNCYLSMVFSNVIKKVTPAGEQSVFATVTDTHILGLAFDSTDNLFVAAGAGVWKITPAGVISLHSSVGPGALNDLALAPDGSMYVSFQLDGTASSIWKIDARGTARLWLSSPLFNPGKTFMPMPVGANGVAVDPQNRFVYVTNTSAGRLVEVRINADGSAGPARVIVENDALIGADGVRLDDRGNFYTAVNLTNRIAKITPEGRIIDVASGGLLSFPTSLALDVRGGRTTLYVCNNGNAFFGATTRDQGLLRISNPDAGRMIQVSARSQIGTGGDILIAGFVVEGTASRTLLIRAVGPSLAGFGVGNALADPRLDVFAAGSGTVAIHANDNWSGDALVSAAALNTGAFPLANAASRDAALLVTLPPGGYTARVSGVGAGTGVALLEIYEVP